MKSIVNHLSANAQVALEGNYHRVQSLTPLYERSNSSIFIELIVDIKLNEIQLCIKCHVDDELLHQEHIVNGQVVKTVRAENFELKTSKIWTYNSEDMAEACIKFLLCNLIYQAMLSDFVEDNYKFAKHLQDEFKYLLDVDIAIY